MLSDQRLNNMQINCTLEPIKMPEISKRIDIADMDFQSLLPGWDDFRTADWVTDLANTQNIEVFSRKAAYISYLAA